ADVFRRDCALVIATNRSESTTIAYRKGVMRGRILPKMPDRRVPPAESSISKASRTRQKKRRLARTYRRHRLRTHCDAGGGSWRKPKILFAHAFWRAPARVVAGIDAGRQRSRAGEAGASARSSGYSSRESFSLLSEA